MEAVSPFEPEPEFRLQGKIYLGSVKNYGGQFPRQQEVTKQRSVGDLEAEKGHGSSHRDAKASDESESEVSPKPKVGEPLGIIEKFYKSARLAHAEELFFEGAISPTVYVFELENERKVRIATQQYRSGSAGAASHRMSGETADINPAILKKEIARVEPKRLFKGNRNYIDWFERRIGHVLSGKINPRASTSHSATFVFCLCCTSRSCRGLYSGVIFLSINFPCLMTQLNSLARF